MSERRDPWQDPRVVAGMARLLERRDELLAAGARPLGWKVALGAPAALEGLGLSGPLVGFLTDSTLIGSGGECAVGGWGAAKLEPEIAIHLGIGGREVAAIGAAIELADVDRPPGETEEVLGGNIYHRGVVLGEPTAMPGGPIAVRVRRDGEPVAASEDAEATLGRLDELAAYVSDYLARFGVESREGEVVISGSTVPPIDVEPGQAWTSQVVGAGEVAVRLGR